MAFSERNYVLSARWHLTAEQEEKIVALVKKVQPEIHFLVVQMKKSYVNHLRPDLVICTGLFLCSGLLYAIEVVSSLHVYSNSVQTIIGCVMLHSWFRYCKVNKDMFKFLLNFETLHFFSLVTTSALSFSLFSVE